MRRCVYVCCCSLLRRKRCLVVCWRGLESSWREVSKIASESRDTGLWAVSSRGSSLELARVKPTRTEEECMKIWPATARWERKRDNLLSPLHVIILYIIHKQYPWYRLRHDLCFELLFMQSYSPLVMLLRKANSCRLMRTASLSQQSMHDDLLGHNMDDQF